MAENHTNADLQGEERIDINQDSELSAWSKKFDATPEQLKEAVAAVGNLASDVELHMKGSRSSSNSEKVHDALQGKAG